MSVGQESGQRGADAILEELEVWGQKLGLESIDQLLEAMGRPQDELTVVLVAGTNGKGSTAALLAAIGHAAGLRTGLYTSPHLERVEERLRIDGQAIGGASLAELLEKVLAAAKQGGLALPTYFEALTASALLHFARRRVELAVLEVGLGGRLDATNVSDPVLSVVTSIGLDHEEQLGSTLAEIASEKAGVARPGRPLLIWTAGQPEVRKALRRAARGCGATLVEVDREVRASHRHVDGQSAVDLETPEARYSLEVKLLGEHQVSNVALAARAAELLRETGYLPLDKRALAVGVSRCHWPGRLERFEIEGRRTILLDGAHNLPAAHALAAYLDSLGEELDLLYGSLGGKRAQDVLPLLAGRARAVTLTEPDTPRALGVATLVSYLAERVPPPVAMRSLREALAHALKSSRRGLLVCGSLYVVGEVRSLLRERFGRPTAAVQISTG